jgi:hypothetical protein
MTVRNAVVVCSAAMICCGATLCEAQPRQGRFYAGASVGTFSVSADHVEGRTPAAGVLAGAALTPWLDIEGDLMLPSGEITSSHTGISVSFAQPGSSREEIERLGVTTRFDRSREILSSLSAVVLFHPPVAGRVTPSFIVGVTNHRVRDRTMYTPVAIPDGVDPNHPNVRAHEESGVRNLGGPTVGASVAIAVTQRLVIAPDVRFDYGSIGDEINNALRVTARAIYRF